MGRFKVDFKKLISDTFGVKSTGITYDYEDSCKYLEKDNFKNDYCKEYIGKACINGSCPKLIVTEELGSKTEIENCGDCPAYQGCSDCEVAGSKYCPKKN